MLEIRRDRDIHRTDGGCGSASSTGHSKAGTIGVGDAVRVTRGPWIGPAVHSTEP